MSELFNLSEKDQNINLSIRKQGSKLPTDAFCKAVPQNGLEGHSRLLSDYKFSLQSYHQKS